MCPPSFQLHSQHPCPAQGHRSGRWLGGRRSDVPRWCFHGAWYQLCAMVRAVWRRLFSRAPLPSSVLPAAHSLPPQHDRAMQENPVALPSHQQCRLAAPPAQKHRVNLWTGFMMWANTLHIFTPTPPSPNNLMQCCLACWGRAVCGEGLQRVCVASTDGFHHFGGFPVDCCQFSQGRPTGGSPKAKYML